MAFSWLTKLARAESTCMEPPGANLSVGPDDGGHVDEEPQDQNGPNRAKGTPAILTTATFEEIANQFQLYGTENLELKGKLQSTEERLQQTEKEYVKILKANYELRTEVGKLGGVIVNEKSQNKGMSRAVQSAQKKAADHTNCMKQLGKDNAALRVEQDQLRGACIKLQDEKQDLQLELELLKCTRDLQATEDLVGINDTRLGMFLPPQPFVAVLIDGDAYSWAHDLFHTPTAVRSPGALAAIRLRNEVTRHITEDDGVSSSARVIARVYINAATQDRYKKRASFEGHQQQVLESFRVQFTEAMPLFDFVDVGHGKERADEKIRENFHLFLPNPHCHRVFLAACTDNGFARMLEPYQYHTAAYEKLVLVTPGYVEKEIASLGFRDVFWPSVFAKRVQSVPLKPKQQKLQQKSLAAARARMETLVRDRKRESLAIKNETALRMIVNTVQVQWDGKVIMGGHSGRVGLRVSEGLTVSNGQAMKFTAALTDEYDEQDDELD